ncbi:hypothetical protein ATC1_13395 [Flexilinea flocculi]|uniref:Uncharacterized protein n=1 Tax=Flexilinea flocculi TaxID=1678840 RepID=A0A0S7BJ91_9CHLR|nr:hypothetical protein ATC1_13395 [Flexilinea flocculi]
MYFAERNTSLHPVFHDRSNNQSMFRITAIKQIMNQIDIIIGNAAGIFVEKKMV